MSGAISARYQLPRDIKLIGEDLQLARWRTLAEVAGGGDQGDRAIWRDADPWCEPLPFFRLQTAGRGEEKGPAAVQVMKPRRESARVDRSMTDQGVSPRPRRGSMP